MQQQRVQKCAAGGNSLLTCTLYNGGGGGDDGPGGDGYFLHASGDFNGSDCKAPGGGSGGRLQRSSR